MPRKDYDEIKTKFAEYVKTFRSKDATVLDNYAYDDVEVRISSSPNSNDSLDKLDGLKTFVSTYPKTDVLQLAIYSYACYIEGNQAQQCGHVICESLNYVDGKEEMDAFYYCILCANHWIKDNDGNWKMSEVHMDVYPFYWTKDEMYNYFNQTWYFGTKLAIPQEDKRYPAVVGELDLPWERIKNPEDVWTEEEKILNCYSKLYLSADYLVSIHRCTTRSKHMDTNSYTYDEMMSVREMVNTLRYKRLKDRYWAHPFALTSIEYNKDHTWARCRAYRVFGWKQRNHEYVWTRSNVNTEHMCMGGIQEFAKEDGEWKIGYGDLTLGLYDKGTYSETLYGDQI